MNFNLTMSSITGMRNARVLPLPVFAAAKRSLNIKKEKKTFNLLIQKIFTEYPTHTKHIF